MSGRPDRETATAALLFFRFQASGFRIVKLDDCVSLAGRRGVTSARRPPLFTHYPCIAPPPFPEAFTALWDGYSTPAPCGCQEVTLYIVSRSNDCADAICRTRFPQPCLALGISLTCRPFTGPDEASGVTRAWRCFTCALRRWLPGRDDVWWLVALCLAFGAMASFHPRVPWLRRHLRKSAGVRCGGHHRMIRPDSRRAVRDVRGRARLRTGVVG
jgi:hypothetical protein